jgi:hypothetical protein
MSLSLVMSTSPNPSGYTLRSGIRKGQRLSTRLFAVFLLPRSNVTLFIGVLGIDDDSEMTRCCAAAQLARQKLRLRVSSASVVRRFINT